MAKLDEKKGDEVDEFVNCRYINAGEATWKLLEQDITGRSHSVQKLACHLTK